MATITITNAAKPTPPAPKIFVSNEVFDPSTLITTFKLHVIGEAFIGYGIAILTNNNANSAQILGTVTIPTTDFSLICKIVPVGIPGRKDTKSKPVTIPPGVYDGELNIAYGVVPESEDVSADLALGFGLTDDFYATLPDTYIQHSIYREGIGGGPEA